MHTQRHDPYSIGFTKTTTSRCGHCRAHTETGIGGGCSRCGKVKHTMDGRKRRRASHASHEAQVYQRTMTGR